MLFKKRVIFITVLMVLFFVVIMFAFMAQKETTENYKGILVYDKKQEAVA